MTYAVRTLAGRYELHRLVGAGGMGRVYAAYDLRLGREVAVKVVRPEHAGDADQQPRFEAEAQAAARLNHPNVIAVFDFGEDGDDLFLVMECLPGRTLADRIGREPLSEEEARGVGAAVLAALAAAHRAGLVHRDVKPGNVLQAVDGTWKVGDFGIAKAADTSAGLTLTGSVLGTPAYIAPEVLTGGPATAASDLYSTGVVLYEALGGRRPYDGPTPYATAQAAVAHRHTPLAQLRPDLDPLLVAAIESAMAADPRARPRDADAMARVLARREPHSDPPSARHEQDGMATTAVLPAPVLPAPVLADATPSPGAPARSARRMRLIVALALGAVLLVLSAALVSGLRNNAREPGTGSGRKTSTASTAPTRSTPSAPRTTPPSAPAAAPPTAPPATIESAPTTSPPRTSRPKPVPKDGKRGGDGAKGGDNGD